MINATLTSRLDYCNSLLYGAKQSHIHRLQCCQNNAAWIITKRRKFDHISPVLRELHWLPAQQRISYKILLLTYKALNGHAPQYLVALISKYIPPRPHLSEDQYLLNSPRRRLSPRQPRPFGTLYPSAWSKLHLLTLSRPDLILTCSTKHFDLYLSFLDQSIINTIKRFWALCLDTHMKFALNKCAIIILSSNRYWGIKWRISFPNKVSGAHGGTIPSD